MPFLLFGTPSDYVLSEYKPMEPMFDKLKSLFSTGSTYSLHTEVLQETEDASEHFFYGLVGEDITASTVIESLKQTSGDIEIHLFSMGGDLFEAAAIYGILNQYPGNVTIYIEGLAASAGAYISVGADELVMEENAMFMIHNAWKIASGNHNELREEADLVEKQQQAMVKAFAAQTGKDRDDIVDLMDEETWMDAEEAVEAGFADRIYANENKVAAEIDDESISQFEFKNIPEKLKQENQQSTKNNDMEFTKAELQKLGLDEDASQEEIKAAVMNKITGSDGPTPTPSQEGNDDTPKSEKDGGDDTDEVAQLKATVSKLENRLDKKDEKDEEERAETLVNAAVEDGKILPADKPAWLNSAKTNFEDTKKALDERDPNSVMPGKVTVNDDAGPENNADENPTKKCADYLRGEMQLG